MASLRTKERKNRDDYNQYLKDNEEEEVGQIASFGGASHQAPADLWDVSDQDDDNDSQATSGIINEKHHKLLKAKGLLKIPEPVVYKNDCAVKGLIVQDDAIIIATD